MPNLKRPDVESTVRAITAQADSAVDAVRSAAARAVADTHEAVRAIAGLGEIGESVLMRSAAVVASREFMVTDDDQVPHGPYNLHLVRPTEISGSTMVTVRNVELQIATHPSCTSDLRVNFEVYDGHRSDLGRLGKGRYRAVLIILPIKDDAADTPR